MNGGYLAVEVPSVQAGRSNDPWRVGGRRPADSEPADTLCGNGLGHFRDKLANLGSQAGGVLAAIVWGKLGNHQVYISAFWGWEHPDVDVRVPGGAHGLGVKG